MDPKVSVIIPLFNREGVISRAVNSVLNQSFNHFEIIVVDDCSTDDSLKRILEFDDSRIRLIKLEKNSGAAVARNEGIKVSKGEYVSLLDSDDFYEPEFLETSLNFLENTSDSVGFSWTGVRYFQGGKVNEQIWEPERMDTSFLTLLNSLHIGTNSGITIKKEVFQKCGYFNSELPAAEDTDFFLRISKDFDYCVIPKILINIERDGTDRLSKNFQKIAQAYNIFLPEHFDIIDSSEILQAKFYYKLMWLNFHIHEKERARNYYGKIPSELKSIKIKIVKYLYEIFPLKQASYIHQKLSA